MHQCGVTGGKVVGEDTGGRRFSSVHTAVVMLDEHTRGTWTPIVYGVLQQRRKPVSSSLSLGRRDEPI